MNRDALENIKVLDLTRIMAGPYCTMMLADFGAEVIKIEVPGKGDDSRAFGPFKNGESLYYANINRNKKSITLNLKHPEGKKIFLDMVKEADMVIENYRPGVMDKLGLGYDVLKEVNDQIIYAAVSGFGCYGPYSDRPGYDIIAQAMGGLMSITGEPNGSPIRVGTAMGDILGGMNLTIGVLIAINARNITGKGQRVDIALVDSVVSSLETATQRYFISGKEPELLGNRYASAYPYDSFKANDGQFVIGCGNQKLYERLCRNVLKREDLLTDPRYVSNDDRCNNHKDLKDEIEKWSCNYSIEEAVDMIIAAGVPAAPILGLKKISENEHIAITREMFVECEHPVIGKMKVNGNPVKLMDTKPQIKTPAPLLGADNEEIYKTLLGMNADEIRVLEEQKII